MRKDKIRSATCLMVSVVVVLIASRRVVDSALAGPPIAVVKNTVKNADQPELQKPDVTPINTLTSPGGRIEPPADYDSSAEALAGGSPNLIIDAIRIVDGSNNPIVPTAGKKFWVRVEFTYLNPVCTNYALGRVVNGWSHTAPEINWGCGFPGPTFWNHFWGAWVIHKGGTYPITVSLDSGNTVLESNEFDNSMTINVAVSGDVTPEWMLVEADAGRSLLGDGTDVIVGTMDDAFDFKHPWLDGLDSRGRPRLIASSQNTLGTDGSPINAGHATAVMGIVLADGINPGDLVGLAPDARYVTAEFINRDNIPGHPVLHVVDAAGFLVQHNVEVINMSWSWWFGTSSDSQTGEGSVTNLMTDYLAYGRNIVCVPAVNQLPTFNLPTAPGAARNALTVGGLKDNLQEAWEQQDHGPTLDGRGKPDLLGNDSTNAVSITENWRNGFPAGEGFNGTSFSAPFVTGAVAQMLDFGKQTGQSTDHRVIKALIMNSAVKAKDSNGSAWSNSSTQPLDDEQGTGILNMIRVHDMYAAGEQSPNNADVPGYDFGEVTGETTSGLRISGVSENSGGGGVITYRLGTLTNTAARLDATLVWDRHTFWNDANTNGIIDAADSFFTDPLDRQDNLDLLLVKDGVVIAQSRSIVDNVEHISITSLGPGEYQLQVARLAVSNSGSGEPFALAWHADGIWQKSCPADSNDDSVVNVTDLLALLAAWGPNPGHPADTNGDDVVNVTDLLALLAAWGQCP